MDSTLHSTTKKESTITSQIYSLPNDKQQKYLISSFNELYSNQAKPADRSPYKSLKEEYVPSFYPSFIPVLDENITRESIDVVSNLSDFADTSQKEQQLIIEEEKLKKSGKNRQSCPSSLQPEHIDFVKDESTNYINELYETDRVLSGVIEQVGNQIRGLVDFLNEGVPRSLPFAYGPYDPTIDIVPFGQTGSDFSSSSTSRKSKGGLWRASMVQKKKDKKFLLKKANVTFSETEEGGEKVPVMNVSLDDLLKDNEEGAPPSDPAQEVGKKKAGEQDRTYLIPRYSITHTTTREYGKEKEKENEKEKEKEKESGIDSEKKRKLEAKQHTPSVVKGAEDMRYMRTRLENVEKAYELVLADAAAAEKQYFGGK